MQVLTRLSLVVVVLIGGLSLSIAARAQVASDALIPKITNVPARAFDAHTLQTGVIMTPAPFTDMLLRWPAPAPGTAPLQLEVRVSNSGSDWSRWAVVEPGDDLPDPSERQAAVWSDPIYAGESHFYQLRVKLPPGAAGSLPLLSSVQVHTVNAELTSARASQPANASEISGKSDASPRYLSRTDWGCPDGESAPDAPPEYEMATHLIVHHTADSNTLKPDEPDWAARVRAIWAFHTHSRGWGDIGYNWLIDPDGVIYAGRAGSTDPDRDAVGFHDTANYGSMGVAIMGNYESVAPSQAAQDNLVELLTWKARQRLIDPLGSSYYAGCARSNYCAPYNPDSVVPNIAGHRQVIPGLTTCPGDAFMELLPTIRQRVAQDLEVNKDARLLAASIKTPTIAVDEVAQVEFTIKNMGDVPLETQAPDGSTNDTPTSGWVYAESECYMGDATHPAYLEEKYRLRATLGYTSDSARAPSNCQLSSAYPWRWGLMRPLQPGETRTIIGSIRFHTPGTYYLRANLVEELVRFHGMDGNGTALDIGSVTVVTEPNAPTLYNVFVPQVVR